MTTQAGAEIQTEPFTVIRTFNAPRDRIMTDVTAMLDGLVEKQLMET